LYESTLAPRPGNAGIPYETAHHTLGEYADKWRRPPLVICGAQAPCVTYVFLIAYYDIRYIVRPMPTKHTTEGFSPADHVGPVTLDLGDALTRAATIEQIQRRVHSLIERIPGDHLKRLVGEDDWSLMSGLADPEILASSRPTARDEARERGRAFKAQLLENHPTWSLREVIEHKGVQAPSINRRVNRGTLIAVRVEGELRFPAFQFDSSSPSGELPGLSDALTHMQLASPWLRFSWFVSPNDRLCGDTPADALREGRKEAVVMVAKGVGEQGGG